MQSIDLNLIILIFTLNVDSVNTLVSRDCQIRKKSPNKNAAKEMCFKYRDKKQVKSKGWKLYFLSAGNTQNLSL